MEGVQFNMILGEDKEKLERAFVEEVVFGSLRAISGDKVPDPDGFIMAFFQCCWSAVKRDVMATLEAFFVSGQFEKSFNVTFLALIPKKGGLKMFVILGLLVFWGECIIYWLKCWPIDLEEFCRLWCLSLKMRL